MKFEIVGQEGVKKEEELLKVRLHVDMSGDLWFQAFINKVWMDLCGIDTYGRFLESVDASHFRCKGITKGN